MSLAETFNAKPNGQGGLLSNLRLPTRETIDNLARAPKFTIPLPNTPKATVYTDRVRAAPAITPTVAGAIGQTAMLLGIAGLFFPKAVKRALGVQAPTPVVQAVFGAREMWSGVSLASDPTKSEVLWARVAGDVFDIVALKALDNPSNPKRGNARAALGFVLAVTALDVVTAVRMTNVQRNCE
ncbi:hypothetical protein [Phenylobacterium deserti]|uniref:Uncharacterized protein n=1 Tax=Phenylobacterium deserti TaxID=1914756 RepID=A0A328ANT4_9CAUL|nr:hypothetical protein [Phenylobacterium deserti]RAK56663.1 hypothetical protein DJ018_01400 [Phenylobacterium deserti]